MPDIFAYTDYRKFLADYYAEHKAQNASFSYQTFSDKAGLPNRGYVHNIIAGKKSLSKSAAVKLAQAMKLNAREADYFDNLVSFNKAKSLRERNYFFEKINAIKSTKPGSATVREMLKNQYEFYANWYLSVIRSLIDMHPFKNDYAWLAKSVYPPIKPKQAQRAVALLAKLGMIKKGRGGVYEVVDKTITAGKEIMQLGLVNFQLQTTQLAVKAIEELPKEKRSASGLTLGISHKTYEVMCKEIEAFQAKLLDLAEQDKEADNVYQINFHFFPISNVNGLANR